MICRYRHREVKVNQLEFAKEMLMKSAEQTVAGQSFQLCSVIFPQNTTAAPDRTHSFLDVKTKIGVLLSI